jgi:hypothetical protein
LRSNLAKANLYKSRKIQNQRDRENIKILNNFINVNDPREALSYISKHPKTIEHTN